MYFNNLNKALKVEPLKFNIIIYFKSIINSQDKLNYLIIKHFEKQLKGLISKLEEVYHFNIYCSISTEFQVKKNILNSYNFVSDLLFLFLSSFQSIGPSTIGLRDIIMTRFNFHLKMYFSRCSLIDIKHSWTFSDKIIFFQCQMKNKIFYFVISVGLSVFSSPVTHILV